MKAIISIQPSFGTLWFEIFECSVRGRLSFVGDAVSVPLDVDFDERRFLF